MDRYKHRITGNIRYFKDEEIAKFGMNRILIDYELDNPKPIKDEDKLHKQKRAAKTDPGATDNQRGIHEKARSEDSASSTRDNEGGTEDRPKSGGNKNRRKTKGGKSE